MPFALLFPGQGAQYVGMGKSIHDAFPAARHLYERADHILGFSVSRLCFEGPEKELSLTINAQPAIFVTSLAIWEVVREQHRDCQPAVTCGLSLGEFSALAAAGSLDFEEGLRLVRKRGEWMQETGEKFPGAMCSVIGLSQRQCEEISNASGVQIANYNSPDQTVLSGTLEGIEKVKALAKEQGARKVIPLRVSGAFHSNLMQKAQDKLAQELEKLVIKKPRILFIPNVLGSFLENQEDPRKYLAKQVTHSVRWTQTIQAIHAKGIRTALEMGPGNVLKGLAKRTVEGFSVHGVESVADIEKVPTVLSETVV